jgi:hypothetical protein
MQNTFSNALSGAIHNHIALSATRRETLGWLASLIMRHGTICLWRLAAHVATAASIDSVRRRFYRFFQHVQLDGAMTAQVVVDVLGIREKPWVLAMDRTNWEFGKATINILMISVIWNGMGVSLIWTLLPSAGNSNTRARTDLLDRLRVAFPDLKIVSLMGDREFIGDAWMAYLRKRKIPFILRLRENQHVVRDGYDTWTIADIARRLAKGEKTILKGWCRLGQGAGTHSPLLRIVVMRLPTNELLALACSGNPRKALTGYRRRWTIETLFANLKTKGFNLEDTHIVDPLKLSTLLAVLALTVTLCVKTGAAAARRRPIPFKKHGRKAWSLFALGLAVLRKIAASAESAQIIIFLQQLLSPKLSVNHLKSMPI